MVYPDREKFKKLAKQGNLIPVYREILSDLDTPVSAFIKLCENPSFLLESVEGGEKWARYSFIGLRPKKIIKGYGRKIEIFDGKETVQLQVDDPFQFLRNVMSEYKPVPVEGLPRFFGGLVGYLGYDMVRFIENIPDKGAIGLDVPDMFLMLTDTLLIFDSLKQTVKVVSCVHLDGLEPEDAFDEAMAGIEDIIKSLKKPVERGEHIKGGASGSKEFRSSFGPKDIFEGAVDRSKEYIKAGDIFQVVLSQRFERKTTASPLNIYRALRVVNPSPYMYYLDIGDAKIVGSSPEILVRLEGDVVTVRPIAGTRKRGGTIEADLLLEEELKKDPKEKAEHIMLVDLGRNDVGRISDAGTVIVRDMMSIEKYSHVMHMVSNVEGRLSKGLDCFDVFKACFPAGTVSGAPKIRAMEIIEELEPVKRGPYAGAVGYFSYTGNIDTCITIRTLIIKDGRVYVQAGAGIVADSIPEREYQETVNKAEAMVRAVDIAEETLG